MQRKYISEYITCRNKQNILIYDKISIHLFRRLELSAEHKNGVVKNDYANYFAGK